MNSYQEIAHSIKEQQPRFNQVFKKLVELNEKRRALMANGQKIQELNELNDESASLLKELQTLTAQSNQDLEKLTTEIKTQ